LKPPFDIAGDLDTPVSAFAKLAPFNPRFLLESVEGGERVGRFSFVGFGEAFEVRLDARGLHVGGRTHPLPTTAPELLTQLRAALAAAPRPEPHIPEVPLAGGLVGYTAYDIVRFFERLPRHAAPLPASPPLLHYVAPRSLLVFDHLTRAIALLHAGSELERAALRREVIAALRGPMPASSRGRSRYSTPSAALSRDEFIAGVQRTQQYIAAGDVYQLVLSSRFSGRHDLDPFQAYRALRLINPSPYMFYCRLGEIEVVGSSPEALVKLSAGQAQLRPIAGTRPRGENASLDVAREQELRADPKENAEHVMLVDLARNERYSHVMHIVSGVHGVLREGCDAFDLFAATFPAGTLVGAPKVRAMQIIEELEPVQRGLYGGTVGYFGARGDMDQAITIRTLVFNGDEYSYQAGAGIVADSRPEAEHDEILAKSASAVRALKLAEAGL